MEVTAPKPGNVHRGADFDDVTFQDFLTSAVLIGPIIIDSAQKKGVGQAVFDSVEATQIIVGKNTNLGAILLLAPLAAVPDSESLPRGIGAVLDTLTTDDAERVYEAIRMAEPGGLGTVEQSDIAGPPPDSLINAMQLAAERDLVARQYVTEFETVFDFVVPSLTYAAEQLGDMTAAIVHTHLQLMAEFPDSLILRKCGPDAANQSAEMAGNVLDSGEPMSEPYLQALEELDFWLRADGHRRNPGTTADLISAGLYAGLRDYQLVLGD